MNSTLIIRNIGRFLLLMLLQVLVFDNIYLGGYINPCLYVLFIAMLPTSTKPIPMMLIAFFTGLVADIATNMLGFNAFACTAVAFLRSVWLDKILTSDNDEEVEMPSIRTGSYQRFLFFLFLVLLIFNLIYHTLLVFDIREFFGVLLTALLSTIVTWILAIIYQSLLIRKVEN